MSRWVCGLALCAGLASWGCSAGDAKATDPTERGLSYVASAIVTAAVIRAFFNE